MHIEHLALENFRNYTEARAELATGANMVVGRNGQGKTNLLEAIHVLCGLGSHRAPSAASMVKHGSQTSVLRGRAWVRGRKTDIDAEIKTPGGIGLRVNRAPVHPSREFGSLPACVLFSPDDLSLIKGGPEERRRFLDQIAAQSRLLAGSERVDFDRVLKQRNGVLKAAQFSTRAKDQLDVWTSQLAAAGSRVLSNRLAVLDSLTPEVAEKYQLVAGSAARVDLIYRASWGAESGVREAAEIERLLLGAFDDCLGRDLERGITTAGPHRDDLEVALEGADARLYASQGEQRTLALALRLSETDLLAGSRGEPPVLMLDDVFSELDDRRRRQVAKVVALGGQSVLTSTGPEDLPFQAERVILVQEGKLSLHE